MRALLGMVLFSMVGCESLWAPFIGQGDFGVTDGGATCSPAASCPDLAITDGPIPDLAGMIACTSIAPCMGTLTPFWDLNVGVCVATAPPTAAFPAVAPFESSISLSKRYMLMATGDFDGDGVTDVAVAGVFNSPTAAPNSTNSTGTPVPTATDVEFFRGDGMGGLVPDTSCGITGELPVYLLTVPGSGLQNDLLVATHGANVYHCVKTGGVWGKTTLSITGPMPPGYKQLALPRLEGSANPDLVVRTSNSLFVDAGMTGRLDIKRSTAAFNYSGTSLNASTSDVTWVVPFRFAGATGDTLATTWDGIGMHPGVEMHYVPPAAAEMVTSGNTGSANTTGAGFSELSNIPFAAVVPFKLKGVTDPALLYTYSNQASTVSVLSGSSAPMFKVLATKPLVAQNITLPYAGDADGNGQDEIGLYSIAPNNSGTRYLQLLSYTGSSKAIDTAMPIFEISSMMENYRGMALGFLAKFKNGDLRRDMNRKDLIMLVETPGAGSKLVIRRGNLNYQFPPS